jgi:gliding motility-associated-like protein
MYLMSADAKIITHCFSFKHSLMRYTLILIILGMHFSFAQNETNNWYFGKNAGLDFSNGDLIVLENGSMVTPAGCSSISDSNGNLLFYTNGQTVWNKNHQIMVNGQDLAGDIAGMQSAIIIPKPNDSSTYYIFYTREITVTSPVYLLTGIYYAEVKFDALNPLGHVTGNKDVRISEVESTARIEAIHHIESDTIRVICITKPDPVFGTTVAEGEFVFRIFNVTPSGVEQIPVIKPINESIGRLGAMKISPDGTYLAFADNVNQKIYFYQYNNDVISFNHYFTMLTIPAFGVFLNPYGIEFSQDSKIFYYTGGSYVVQFPYRNLGGMEPADYYLMTVPNAGSIQLARDGKIYIAQGDVNNPTNHISVINNPEKMGEACNFSAGSIHFDNAASTRGLPLFVASYLRSRIIPTDDDCVDVAFTFELDAYRPIVSVEWDFGDGITSTDFNPTHLFSTPGIHKVAAKIVMDNNQEVILYKNIQAYPLPVLSPNQILSQCDTDGDGFSIFNLENIKDLADDVNSDYTYTFYHTLADANNDNNQIQNFQHYANVSNPEQIFVKIVSSKGCTTITNFSIESYQANTLPIRSMYVCESSDDILNNSEGKFNIGIKELDIRAELGIPPGFTITLYVNQTDAQTKINPLDKYYIGPTTLIWVRIEDASHNCFGLMPFNAIVNSNIQPDIESQYTICDPSAQPAIVLDGGAANDSWQWKNQSGAIISTQRHFHLSQGGNYSLTVFREENGLTCSVSKNFTVKTVTEPVIENSKAEDGEIFISVIGESDYQFSLNGINYFGSGNSYTFMQVPAGVYTIYVKDVYNCEKSLTTSVHMLSIPKFFSPNDDGINDTWKLTGLSRSFYSKADIQIFDRYGKVLCRMNMDQNMNGWYGNYDNRKLPATDYWYRVMLTDLNNNVIIKKGHFSLIR